MWEELLLEKNTSKTIIKEIIIRELGVKVE
jgi:hypothetical protein